MNLASLSLRISPKFQSRTNVPLHSRSFIVTIRLIIVMLSFAHQRDFLWPNHRSEFRPKVRAKEMSRSFLAHLSFNFYRSCQADYRHAQYRLSARLFMARISPASRLEFSYGDLCQALFNLVQLGFDSVVCVMKDYTFNHLRLVI